MKISTLTKSIAFVCISLGIIILGLVYEMNASIDQERHHMQRQSEFMQLGNVLAQTSDFLTREARRYTIFGDKRHHDAYWKEVNETKTIDKIVDRLKELKATPSELGLLEKAKTNSDKLILVEIEAMKAVAEGDLNRAQILMFNEDYDRSTRSILMPIQQFQRALNIRAAQEAQVTVQKANNLLKVTSTVILFYVLLIFTALYFIFVQKVANPIAVITKAIDRIASGKPDTDIPYTNLGNEIGSLAQAAKLFKSSLVKNQDLAHSLKDLNQDLEARVNSRTNHLNNITTELQTALGSNELQMSSLKRMTAAIEELTEGIVVFTNDYTVLYSNVAYGDIFEHESDLMGQQHPDWENIASQFCSDETKALTPQTVEFKQNHSVHGAMTIIVTLAEVVRDDNSSDYILTCVDMTKYRELEADLQQAQKLESMGQLAAGIAHEINTPTQYVGDNTSFLDNSFRELSPLLKKAGELANIIDNPTESLKLAQELKTGFEEADLEYLEEEIPRAIEQSLEGLDRVRTIVRSMKAFSHPGGKQMSPTDINKSIEDTTIVATSEWKYVAELETHFDSELPLIPCLPNEFNQVVLNIIVNAAHAIEDMKTDDSSGLGKIIVSTHQEGEFAEVRISDTGGGIPEDIRDKIFDPFFTTKEVGKGTGQGLSIAYQTVVKTLGGTIDIETEMGKGSTFIIRLPMNNTVIQEAA